MKKYSNNDNNNGNNNNDNNSSNNDLPINKKKNKLKKISKILFICTVIVFFTVGATLGYSMYSTREGKKIVETEWGASEFDIPQSEEMVNALVIGIDKSGLLTDTMMVVNYDPKTSKVNLISIPRDTIIGIRNSKIKLNSAFAYGKFDMTLNAIRELTGLPIHYYVAVDTNGFKEVIDTLGGVEFDVKQNMYYYDPSQNLKIDLKKGKQLLDGAKSEQLVRFRKYAMGDLDRTEVQKQFIKALIEQKLNLANVSDIPKMKQIYDTLAKHVKTNLAFNDAIKYVVSAVKITPEKVSTYILPGQAKNINGLSYYVYNKKQTIDLFSRLTGIDKIKIEQGMEINDKITTYDIGVINSMFPARVETQIQNETPKNQDNQINSNGISNTDTTKDTTKSSTSTNITPSSNINTDTSNNTSTDAKGSATDDNTSTTRNPFTTENGQDNDAITEADKKQTYF